MALPIPIPTGKLLELADRKFTNWLTRKTERIEVQNLRLALPAIMQNDARDTPVMQFELIFQAVNKTPQPIDDFAWGIVLKHESETPGTDVAIHNLRGTAASHDGVTEPQFAPVVVQTDFERFIRFMNDPISGSITMQGIVEFDTEVTVKVKVRAANVAGHIVETTLQELLAEWVSDHEGMNVSGFQQEEIDDDSKFVDGVVGEDIRMP